MSKIERMITCGAIVAVMMSCLARAQSPELLALPKAETYLPKIKAELERMDAAAAQGPYKPDLESFKNHRVPEWLKDAKVGLWYDVAGIITASEKVSLKEVDHADFWCEYMYKPGTKVFEAHRKLFGDQKVFGCKDLFPLYKAEKFDPEDFASLCIDAGAKFGGPTAAWVDNFYFWDSEVHRWNTKLIGPKRDMVGEMLAALEKRNLHTFVYMGAELSWGYFGKAHDKTLGFDATDPRWNDLYHRSDKFPVDQEFIDRYLASVNELNRKYLPDLIYFDLNCLGQRIGRQNMLRHMAARYNMAHAKGKEVDVLVKHHDLQPFFGVLENEAHMLRRLHPWTWTITIPVGPTWFCQKDMFLKSTDYLVAMLVDVVSKNGILNLNIPPYSDGTVPQDIVVRLREMGGWLKVNGEAIYGTRAWRIPEEGGPNRFIRDIQDIHFTRKGGTVYVIAGTWPKQAMTVKSMALGSILCPEEITQVSLIGHGPVKWTRTAEGLVIEVPDKKPCENAWAFKVETQGKTCTEPELTLVDDDGNFTATVTVNNFTAGSWSPQVKMMLGGKEYMTQPADVAPGQNQTLKFKGKLPGPGTHELRFVTEQAQSGTLLAQMPRMPLEGEWKFHRGDDKAWAGEELDEKDWQTVKLPNTWDKHSGIARGYHVFGWYHRQIQIPPEAKGHGLRLTLGNINTRGWLYFNGHPLGESEWSSWSFPQVYDVPAELVKAGASNTIAVRVEGGFIGNAPGGITKDMGCVEFTVK